MGKIFIKIEKEDVNTTQLGVNVCIHCENNIDIVFSREALEELIADYQSMTWPPEPPAPPADRIIREGKPPIPPKK